MLRVGQALLLFGLGFVTSEPRVRAQNKDTAGTEIYAFKGLTKAVGGVAFSPVGKLVLPGSDDKTARVWKRED
jgi:WD40 repeat protein